MRSLNILKSNISLLPVAPGITYFWGIGSSLGVCLVLQIASGVVLAMAYTASSATSFETCLAICTDSHYGWGLRYFHANGASLVFILLYAHLSRGVYFQSFRLSILWISGIVMFIIVMATAFLGYCLPWGQMSYWGTTVVASMISVVPYIGEDLVIWIWGGFSIGSYTITRFYALHFIIPLMILPLSAGHLFILHETGSSNPLGMNSNFDKVPFNSYLLPKDFIVWGSLLGVLFSVVLLYPWALGDPENFTGTMILVTPKHIMPEWYFLFLYCVLRSIPNKAGGVVVMALALVYLVSLSLNPNFYAGVSLTSGYKTMFWSWIAVWVVLTLVGGSPSETPWLELGRWATLLYFVLLSAF